MLSVHEIIMHHNITTPLTGLKWDYINSRGTCLFLDVVLTIFVQIQQTKTCFSGFLKDCSTMEEGRRTLMENNSAPTFRLPVLTTRMIMQ